jgi:hypothetical protein
MFLVSVGAGVGIGGDGVGTLAVPELPPPHATRRKPAAIAAKNDLEVLMI